MKIIRFFAVLFTVLSLTPLMVHALSAPSVSASSAVLIDASSGRILYGKNENERRGMASTTKIMTAIVAIENAELDKLVTVAPAAVGVEGSSVYLYAGEDITMETLLYALMLQSANDAAAAIAYDVAGGIEDFAAMMNEKARELGLSDTHFMNPHGLDDEITIRLPLSLPKLPLTHWRTIPLLKLSQRKKRLSRFTILALQGFSSITTDCCAATKILSASRPDSPKSVAERLFPLPNGTACV